MTDNSAQIEYWNGAAGDTWVRSQQQLDAMLGKLSGIATMAADAQSGERVVDVGCGCGSTSLALASSGAAVWGVDISEPMLQLAKQRAAERKDIVFSQADAATQSFTPDHDLVFSRFGVMFFADPVAAFTNLRTALRPTGRLVFVCWQAPRENGWVSVGGKAVQSLLPEAEPVDPRAPGPFAFADPEYLRGILTDAGFTDVRIDSKKEDLSLGATLDEALAFQSEVGPLARAVSELDPDAQVRAQQAVREALTPYVTDDGVVLGSAIWLVQASNAS